MKKELIVLALSLTFLILALLIGSPIEISSQPGHRIATIVAGLFMGTIIFYTFKLSLRFKQRVLKIGTFLLTLLITIPYAWISLWTIPQAIYSSNYPMWQDVLTYTNIENEKVVGQFMEISGSIHASQNRKIYYDFSNGVRISLYWPESRLNGVWTETKHGNARIVQLSNGRELK